jgi:hypothetical protein
MLHKARTVGRPNTQLLRDVLDARVRRSLRVPARLRVRMYPFVQSVASMQMPLDCMLPENWVTMSSFRFLPNHDCGTIYAMI